MSGGREFEHVRRADFRVRRLVPEDLPMVLDIERQGYSFPWSESVFRDCFRDNYRLWALVSGECLTGYAVVAYMFDEAHLLNICISPKIRGAGAGRLLLRHLLAESSRDGMEQMILEVRVSNDVASALYLSEGFSEIGVRPNYYPAADGREDARVMALAV
ncbi:MAG: ribosomal-protein-alanine N-acetyltransferase [Gammaproteobacteria bacterium]|nr:MAG: ribosomal-protein-alanine N-acetyltransferase [Gammaproteobacteria bacterium]